MGILGSAGYIYMIIMVALLIGGLGLVLLDVYSRLTSKKNAVQENNNILKGGIKIMGKNGWIKLAVFSLTGIVISFALLFIVNPSQGNNMRGYGYGGYAMQQPMNMYGQPGMYGQDPQHLQHLAAQQGMANMYGQQPMNMPQGNMYGQGMQQPMAMTAGYQQMQPMGMNPQQQMLMMQMQQMQQEIMMMKQQMMMQGGGMQAGGGAMPMPAASPPAAAAPMPASGGGMGMM